MEQLVDTGKARAIGVSNFTIPQLERLLSFARIKPVCNQVEAHPWFPQKEMLDYCRRTGIIFVAYSPLGTQPGGMHTIKARLMDDEDVVAVAKKNGVEAAQVLIAWAREYFSLFVLPCCHVTSIDETVCTDLDLVQRGTVAIPKSSTPSRIVSNFNGT
jgi:diketogulonate reductase-like aldo/keto reductase